MEHYPQIQYSDAEGFSKRWTFNGAAIFLDKYALTFAKDFANVVLRNYVDMLRSKAAAAQKPLIVES